MQNKSKSKLEEAYSEMSRDMVRETEAVEWAEIAFEDFTGEAE